MKLIERIKQDVEGVKALKDWLGSDATPVPHERAQGRANICEQCPQNYTPAWWNAHDKLKDAVALAIRYQLEMKTHLKMDLDNESSLGTCRLCGCNIRLKAWAPISVLKEHINDKFINEAPGHCWQVQELSESMKEQT